MMDEKEKMVRKLDERTVEVSLPSRIGYERIAMDCSASFAKIVGFVSERIEDLKSAVAEACINAIEHGNRGRPDARVTVTMNFKDYNFSVSIRDEGGGILEIPQDADVEKKVEKLEPPKGLGVYLIKQLVDQVEFNKITREGHEVRMVIRLTN
ncbi:MAG: ATP-binding protein [candidate division Zixibacteria bacterium]|nr:ATP-binding protein [candidate division Zixibacteria bacterium]